MTANPAKAGNIYTIPAGIGFADALAAQILREAGDTPEKLAEYRILLPTRRGCRTLRESFLRLSEGKPILLPRLQSIGDMEEDEISFHIAGKDSAREFFDLPPSIPKIKRQFLLARAIQGAQREIQDKPIPFSQATGLAVALGHFMDQIHTEGLDMQDLAGIVPEEFASHWQITLDFLKILSQHWPEIQKENGYIDYAQRRNLLIETLAKHWSETPPQSPVIIAGTTGSIPAVSKLIQAVSAMPQGRIVLPGLDLEIDAEDWDNLDETHPQFGLKALLSAIGTDKDHVRLWPHTPIAIAGKRALLSREIMRPAASTHNWTNISQDKSLQQNLLHACESLQYYECDTPQQEAALIALLMRECVETPGKTAALITPDRNLARNVRIHCKYWNIEIDDSAGQELSTCNTAVFLRACLDAARQNAAPVSFLAMLKHSLLGHDPHAPFAQWLGRIEINALRGLKPADTLEAIEKAEAETEDGTNIENEIISQLKPIIINYNNILKKTHDLSTHLREHIDFCESLLKTLGKDPASLWRGEEGEAIAKLFAELIDHGDIAHALDSEDYAQTLLQLLKAVTVRPTYGTHPRLSILGQLEARLLDKDLIILAGLNEGTWPAGTGHDPWMSRPMRKDFGLPSPERSIGLSAHDFTQCLAHEQVILTRSATQSGAPTVPARWLQRLETILSVFHKDLHNLSQNPYLDWTDRLNKPEQQTPCARPAPTPPIEARPRQLSVTRIETWLKDPYSIYASAVLKLKALKPLEKQPDAADRGEIIHNVIDRFIKENNAIDDNTPKLLSNYSQLEMQKIQLDESSKAFWQTRFDRAFHWLAAHEKSWREHAEPLRTESSGKITLQTANAPFTLTARADRIDRNKNGGAIIIDYKSGGSYSAKSMESGKTPQLPLEGLILNQGGFALDPQITTETLSYWLLSGNKKPGEAKTLDQNIDELIDKTQENLVNLIDSFDDESVPYYSLPNLDNAPRYNDYEYLARVKEWSVSDNENSGEA